MINNDYPGKTQIFRDKQLQLPLFGYLLIEFFQCQVFWRLFHYFGQTPCVKILEIFISSPIFEEGQVNPTWMILLNPFSEHSILWHFLCPKISANEGKECPILLKNRTFFNSSLHEIFPNCFSTIKSYLKFAPVIPP